MAVIIGSARADERGKYSGGAAGDQNGREVSTQSFYLHSRGWYVLRPKSAAVAAKIAQAMKRACDNPNIGYSQSDRYSVLKHGTGATVKCNADCSSLVRQCIKEATGKDVGDFSTAMEPSVLENSGLFEKRIPYGSNTTLYTGDVLVTKTKGHTVVVTSGAGRTESGGVAIDHATSKDSSLAGTYTVTASSLNIRSGAGTNKAILTALPQGTKVQCYGYYTEISDVKWLYVQKGSLTGYVSSRHVQRV